MNSGDGVPGWTVPKSRLRPSTGQRSLMARGWPLSEVPARAPLPAEAPRTTVSWPICQVRPPPVGAASTNCPQDAWSEFSWSTPGAAGWQVSTVIGPAVCCAQVTGVVGSPCTHSPDTSRWTSTACALPSVAAACTVT